MKYRRRNNMYAIGLDHYGGPEVLHTVELPDPQPKAGEIRVKVRAAGINPVDVMVREGALAALYAELDPPFVPGMDIAGTIDMIGDDVDQNFRFTVGQEVVGMVDNHGSYGGYSEYVCLPAASV
ncbi:MAG TPA: alcohol dehydrogenase catalytic domain-containing protein, partial [Balneolaceae bacterium]|nr:alcohol dehydrogenase catalytic domain-containing protein [Balneolaceae bacterium]